jgi:hypothetical protein
MPMMLPWYERNRDMARATFNGIELFELMMHHALGGIAQGTENDSAEITPEAGQSD